MFFVLSKIFWLIAQPISVVMLLILGALALVLVNRRRSAMAALFTAAVLLGGLSFTSIGYLLIQPLEDRFARPDVPSGAVSAIVMLGGATVARASSARQTVALNDAGERLTTTLWLAMQYPEARIVLSGGGGLLSGETESEAETARRFFIGLGIEEERLVLEGQSRNTAENAQFSRNALGDAGGTIILVTSAFHMPRSVGLFRQAGIDVVPWPADYRSSGTQGFGLDTAAPDQNLDVATTALREWIGLAVYRLTGQIETIFPGP
ncbi:YdcF family protein [Devosia sp. CAU 1758]